MTQLMWVLTLHKCLDVKQFNDLKKNRLHILLFKLCIIFASTFISDMEVQIQVHISKTHTKVQLGYLSKILQRFLLIRFHKV